ncbi:hypothetical protein G6L37_11855 [Agrobacterium rubi]|uniref:hypothetical protein n=1 Tax=Agrobacterium rubi TaxID=28099 RepID=UPI001573338C|nr:hypothetical protein [Agrobacterium rubi]NTF06856.1 hypothetical protein [Agrobacterium rubi]NTF19098.1 hypothetical protein [Agrobacterium rubi]NTF26061.1 hypothetical protein [Agrobacterium rubi]
MTDITSTDWTPQDEGNISASPNGSQGGFAPNTIPPTIRAIRGAVKRAHNKINAILTTTGTATALILTHTVAPAALVKGERYSFFSSQTNTGAMTLNVNGLGAKAILQQDGTALKASQVVAGSAVCVIYDGVAFRLEQYVSNPAFSGTVSADAFSTTGALSAGATTVLSLTTSGTVTASSVVSNGLTINAAAGTDRIVGWKSAGTQRWTAFANASPETGNNVGSDFAVARYADNGNYIDAPLSINRATGNVWIEKQLTVKSRLYVGTGGTFVETDGNIVFTGGMTTHGVNLGDALSRKANLTSPNFSGVVGLPGVSTNEFKQGTADGASYSQYNIAMRGWWGLGMQDHTNTVNGYYDFRAGKWDTKGGTFKNGTEYVFPNGAMYDLSILHSAGKLRDAGSPSGRAMTFNWSGQGGQPSWLWGGNDGQNMYVYQPSNFSVANSAQLGGLAASEYATKNDLYYQVGSFQSGNQTYAGNSVGSVAHGLGRKPNWYIAEMVCVVASNGWAVGETFDQASAMQPWTNQGTFGIVMWANATSINWKIASAGIGIIDKNNGGAVAAPGANWQLRFRAGF